MSVGIFSVAFVSLVKVAVNNMSKKYVQHKNAHQAHAQKDTQRSVNTSKSRRAPDLGNTAHRNTLMTVIRMISLSLWRKWLSLRNTLKL